MDAGLECASSSTFCASFALLINETKELAFLFARFRTEAARVTTFDGFEIGYRSIQRIVALETHLVGLDRDTPESCLGTAVAVLVLIVRRSQLRTTETRKNRFRLQRQGAPVKSRNRGNFQVELVQVGTNFLSQGLLQVAVQIRHIDFDCIQSHRIALLVLKRNLKLGHGHRLALVGGHT